MMILKDDHEDASCVVVVEVFAVVSYYTLHFISRSSIGGTLNVSNNILYSLISKKENGKLGFLIVIENVDLSLRKSLAATASRGSPFIARRFMLLLILLNFSN